MVKPSLADLQADVIFTAMNFRRYSIVFLLVLFGALFFLNHKPLSLVKQGEFETVSIGGSGYMLRSTIHIDNPNLLSATVKAISESFFIDGRKIAIMNLELNQGIPGMKETALPVNVRFSKGDIESLLMDSTKHTIKAGVSVQGEITFQNMFSSGSMPVSIQDSVLISE